MIAPVPAEAISIPRSSLALAMLCAWNNIPEGQAPPEWWNHPSDQNRMAWERVAEAARKHIAAEEARAVLWLGVDFADGEEPAP